MSSFIDCQPDEREKESAVGKCGACGSIIAAAPIGSGMWCPDTQKQTTVVPVLDSQAKDTQGREATVSDDQGRNRRRRLSGRKGEPMVSRRKGATPKDLVLARYPKASVIGLGTTPTSGGYLTYAVYPNTGADDYNRRIGDGQTADLAWADAAKRLRGKR